MILDADFAAFFHTKKRICENRYLRRKPFLTPCPVRFNYRWSNVENRIAAVRMANCKAYYRFWREKGKLRKVYVRRADVERVKAACALRVEERNFILAFINTPAGDTIRKEIRQMLRSAGAQPKIINRYRSRFR